ncbi:MAG: hypothetical protein H7210_00815, partial [Pyrinomonadaceae bacterium]|nr:hypothetical protein [Phycisphaerales bacterium]
AALGLSVCGLGCQESPPKTPGEKTGGRPGGKPSMNSAAKVVSVNATFRGEQTGGRPG